MCEPTTLAASSTILGLIGTGVSAAGQHSASSFAAQQARDNALLADAAATDAVARGEQQAGRYAREASALAARQRAAYAGSGVDLSSGSVQAVVEGTERIAREDLETIRLNAAREAWGLREQAGQMRKQAKYEAEEGFWRTGATLVSGLSNVVGGIAKMKG